MVKSLLFFLTLFLTVNVFSQRLSWMESEQGLYIELYKDNNYLGGATGFIIKSKTRNYLVTNYHVLTNKTTSGKWNDPTAHVVPNKVAIFHHSKEQGKYLVKHERLSAKGKDLWSKWLYKEGKKTMIGNVGFLPLTDTADISFVPVDFEDRFEAGYGDEMTLHSYPTGIIDGLTAPVTPAGLLTPVVEIKSEKNPISLFYQDVTASSFKGLSGSPVYHTVSDSTANLNDSTITTKETLKFSGIASALNSKQFSIVPIKYLYKVMAKLP